MADEITREDHEVVAAARNFMNTFMTIQRVYSATDQKDAAPRLAEAWWRMADSIAAYERKKEEKS